MLHYKMVGDTTKPTLLLLHGFMESMQMWDFMLEDLSSAYHVVMLDFPGHGASRLLPQEIYEMSDLAQEVKKVVDHLGLKRIHLHGHSMGGYVALAYAEAYPDDLAALGLFFSTHLEDSPEKKKLRSRSFRVVQASFSAYVKAGIPNLFDQNKLAQLQAEMEIAKNIALNTQPDAVLACLKGMIARPGRTAVLQHLQCPILLLNGEHDLAIDGHKNIYSLAPMAHVEHHMLDCGHCGHWELPQTCSALMLDFLDGML
jgi:pimeloyl-ACP methyl ester carboxylesterase